MKNILGRPRIAGRWQNKPKYLMPARGAFRLFHALSCLFALILIGTAGQALAQTGSFGDLLIEVEAITNGGGGGGYDEYRATIVNRSPSKAHQVTLTASGTDSRVVFVGGGGMVGPRIGELKRTIEVAPSATAKTSLWMLSTGVAGMEFAVTIDGERQESSAPVNFGRTNTWVRKVNNKVFLLVSQSVSKSGWLNEPAAEEGFKDSSGNVDVAYLPYEFPLKEWSGNWLGYSRFDGIIVTADELRAMPEEVRFALLRYVQCGGSLLVIGSWEAPQQWQARRESVRVPADDQDEKETAAKNFSSSSGALSSQGPQTFYLGFGALTVTGDLNPKQIDAAHWRGLKVLWEESKPGEVFHQTISDINREFSVVDRIGTPVRGLFVVMILFVLVIGPINLIWLARRRKKIWLLWTVPAISLLTCLAVTGFAFLGEGVNATMRTEAMTILDEVSHQATTIGWTAFYSPVTSGEGLHFSPDTELMPRWPVAWEYGRVNAVRTVDWTVDQHLASGWITARVPAYFKFRKSETRRERLTVKPEANDAVSIVNGLGAPIRQLWWADRSGKLYTATNIPVGSQSTLTRVNLDAGGSADELRSLFHSDNWLGTFNKFEVNPREALMPNCYLAVLDASPFVEEGMRNTKIKRLKTLVYGIQ